MGEEIAFENGRISDFQGLVTLTLTLDRVILHTAMYHSSTSTHIQNFMEIEETFCGWTDGRADGLETHFIGRLGGVDLTCYICGLSDVIIKTFSQSVSQNRIWHMTREVILTWPKLLSWLCDPWLCSTYDAVRPIVHGIHKYNIFWHYFALRSVPSYMMNGESDESLETGHRTRA